MQGQETAAEAAAVVEACGILLELTDITAGTEQWGRSAHTEQSLTRSELTSDPLGPITAVTSLKEFLAVWALLQRRLEASSKGREFSSDPALCCVSSLSPHALLDNQLSGYSLGR
ncbi:unnamed protein product [Pleuronectes platessa]|uniref:Uncharacterized protein n=1 Tax=Pleuronectes platessa TaxID=8262 RepID=A0A9N7V724_PLEPL|nr:unnamed protein product [Pleuronectes platessa]